MKCRNRTTGRRDRERERFTGVERPRSEKEERAGGKRTRVTEREKGTYLATWKQTGDLERKSERKRSRNRHRERERGRAGVEAEGRGEGSYSTAGVPGRI